MHSEKRLAEMDRKKHFRKNPKTFRW